VRPEPATARRPPLHGEPVSGSESAGANAKGVAEAFESAKASGVFLARSPSPWEAVHAPVEQHLDEDGRAQ
jgi:hypothetical protein